MIKNYGAGHFVSISDVNSVFNPPALHRHRRATTAEEHSEDLAHLLTCVKDSMILSRPGLASLALYLEAQTMNALSDYRQRYSDIEEFRAHVLTEYKVTRGVPKPGQPQKLAPHLVTFYKPGTNARYVRTFSFNSGLVHAWARNCLRSLPCAVQCRMRQGFGAPPITLDIVITRDY